MLNPTFVVLLMLVAAIAARHKHQGGGPGPILSSVVVSLWPLGLYRPHLARLPARFSLLYDLLSMTPKGMENGKDVCYLRQRN